jgi:hypothetical protein
VTQYLIYLEERFGHVTGKVNGGKPIWAITMSSFNNTAKPFKTVLGSEFGLTNDDLNGQSVHLYIDENDAAIIYFRYSVNKAAYLRKHYLAKTTAAEIPKYEDTIEQFLRDGTVTTLMTEFEHFELTKESYGFLGVKI